MPTAIPGSQTTFEILKPGDGASAVAEKNTVTVHATGCVKNKDDGSVTKFWSTKDEGQQAFTYTAGVGQVISGWDKGLLGMKVGEERKVIIPPEEGYGEQGFPAWGIPGNATLEFTLEILNIQ